MKTPEQNSKENFSGIIFNKVRLSAAYVVVLFFQVFGACLAQPVRTISDRRESRSGKQVTYDVIIVPGVPFKEKGWSWIMQTRVYWAKILLDRGVARKVMFSGGAVYTPYCEAEIMALYGEAIGIPREAILTEVKAEHSVENIYNSYLIAKALGYDKIALATDPFQNMFLKKFTKENIDTEIGFLPIRYNELDAFAGVMTDPTIDFHQAYRKNFVSILERDSDEERAKRSRGEYIVQELGMGIAKEEFKK